MTEDREYCLGHGVYPTVSQLIEALGPVSFGALITAAFLVLIFNLILFFILTRKFIKVAPVSQVPNLIWVNSLFSAIPLFICMMLLLPKSTEFILAFYRVYEALVICRFVELHLMWYGGEKRLMKNLGEESMMRFNLPPCCCLLWLRNRLVTRSRVKMVRAMVRQMSYIQTATLFLQQVLYFNGFHTGELSLSNPQTFVKLFGRVSFLCGLYGLFFFFTIEKTFNLLAGFQYIQKFAILKITLIAFILQETLLEGLASASALPCSPLLSTSAWAAIILCSLVIVETSLLGAASFVFYFRHPTVSPGKDKVQQEVQQEIQQVHHVQQEGLQLHRDEALELR